MEHAGRSGVVLAFSVNGLVALAERADAVIEVLPQVGDSWPGVIHSSMFEGAGSMPRACGPASPSVRSGPWNRIRASHSGSWWTSPSKALSPAINDPTTAVMALDQIHSLLMNVGKRRLAPAGGHTTRGGNCACTSGPSDWSDYVSLAVTEIRQFGGSSMQVVRRLRAMIEHLLQVLPEGRRAALERELSLLRLAVERSFPEEQDRRQALVGDFPGAWELGAPGVST